jgi:hypothetical protein
MRKTVTAINIQYPISQLLLQGIKTIETRTYRIPAKHVGKEMAIIETPGKTGAFVSRIIGTIVFGESFLYPGKDSFYADTEKHYVDAESPWKWDDKKPKWGWPVISVKKFDEPLPAPTRKGIKFTHGIDLNITLKQ